jgi:hypothetical protein
VVAWPAMKAFWLVLLLCGACRSDEQVGADGGYCGNDSDCGAAQFCARANDGNRRAGACYSAGCDDDSDCTNDRFCVQKTCAVRRVGDCDRDRMCPVGMVCGVDTNQCSRL